MIFSSPATTVNCLAVIKGVPCTKQTVLPPQKKNRKEIDPYRCHKLSIRLLLGRYRQISIISISILHPTYLHNYTPFPYFFGGWGTPGVSELYFLTHFTVYIVSFSLLMHSKETKVRIL